jgi:hypothetical protein
MIWLYFTLVLTCAVTVYLLWKRRSRFVFLAATALVLAGVALATGLGIGWLLAPVALLLQTTALAAHLRECDRKRPQAG